MEESYLLAEGEDAQKLHEYISEKYIYVDSEYGRDREHLIYYGVFKGIRTQTMFQVVSVNGESVAVYLL